MNQITNKRENYFFDPLFEAFFGDNYQERNFGFLPMKTDIKENKDTYELAIEIPGFDKKDIKLDYEDEYLTVTASINRFENKEGNYIRRERFSGVNSRSYYIGEIDEKKIKASYKDGVLFVTFPKENLEEKEAKHAIAID